MKLLIIMFFSGICNCVVIGNNSGDTHYYYNTFFNDVK